MQEVISAIDIGTTKICALMAAVEHDSLGNITLNMLGEGQVASRGIRRGVVVNVAEVTAGGVPLAEIDLKSMQSRICPKLYFCGEICDVDGRIGGYNFQWAGASGFVVGSSI